ncbi:MAG TPA: DUF542 domain-containing protein [Kofleriaceae bacterium]|nr:DUF542 domain-containing protein [Kofleriaceae bacterium]
MTTELAPSRTVAEIVLDHSECGMVFQRHRIDFCCRGERTVETAASERGVALDQLMGELRQAVADRRGPTPAMRELTTAQLVDHIVSKHHAYLRKTLPFVVAISEKVARVHGEHNPKLWNLAEAVDELAGLLLPHLDEEETTLFPALRASTRTPAASRDLAAMLTTMQADHHGVAAILERIRAASDDFSIPSWACGSYRMLFKELQAIENDTFTHVHLENHVLAPRFAEPHAQTFSLADEAAALEATPAYATTGHAATTLFRRGDARQLVIALRAGAQLAEHRTEHAVVVQVLRGRVQLHTPNGIVDLADQQQLLLEAGVAHDLVAIAASRVLVTICWQEQPLAAS